MKVKRTVLRDKERSADWVPSTDFLLTLRRSDGRFWLLAIAAKPDATLLTRRQRKLLELEREYWTVRDVEWLLITADLFSHRYARCLEREWYWGLLHPVDSSTLLQSAKVIKVHQGRSYSYVLERLTEKLDCAEQAKHAFWQTVWKGLSPIDMRRGWRPHEPVILMPEADFWQLNPIVSRRSSWI